MPTNENPVPVAFVICEQVIIDQETKNKTLVGTFNSIFAQSFPCAHPRMDLFVALTNGQGQATVRITCKNEETGALILDGSLAGEFPNPLDVVEFVLKIRGMPFPNSGSYLFEVMVNGFPITERRLSLVQH